MKFQLLIKRSAHVTMALMICLLALTLYGCHIASNDTPDVTVHIESGESIPATQETPASPISNPDMEIESANPETSIEPTPTAVVEMEVNATLANNASLDGESQEQGQPTEIELVSKRGLQSSALATKHGIPSHLTSAFTAVDGWLKVNINADVLVPTSEKMPVAEAEPADFSQDVITKLFDRLCGELDMYDSSGNRSNGILSGMQSNFTDNGVMVSYSTTGLSLQSADGKTVFNAINLPSPRSAIDTRRANVMFWTERGLHDYSDYPVCRISKDSKLPKEASGKLSTSPSKAFEKVHALVKDTGLMIADAYLVHDAKNAPGASGKASRYAYKFLCTRSINGVPTATVFGESATQTGAMQTKSWAYELMEVIVDDTGIIRVYWYSPHTITRVSNSDAKLLPFNEIQRKLEEAMTKEYGKMKTQFSLKALEIDIIYISLSLQRVTESGSIDRGTYVPAWNFYGHETQVEKNGDRYYSPRYAGCNEICLSINAIDGSIINTRTGR
ncbi:DUF6034 family protein [Eubacteriales bacterium OttesenSCG-928-K08]|nr:DUF6034 family protein [Eubacteriales bacterium OttesenSCG-928-K08]